MKIRRYKQTRFDMDEGGGALTSERIWTRVVERRGDEPAPAGSILVDKTTPLSDWAIPEEASVEPAPAPAVAAQSVSAS